MRSQEYSRRYDLLHAERTTTVAPAIRQEYLLRQIGRGKRVLDLGCLGGKFSKLIKEQNNEVFGVEINPKAAAEAESRGIRVKLFDLNDGIPFDDATFDVIYAGFIFEEVFDTRFLLEECARVLKTDGVLLFTAFNLNSIRNRLKILKGDYPEMLAAFPDEPNGRQIRVFNLPKLFELCRYTGFNIQEALGFTSFDQELMRKSLQPVLRRMQPLLIPILRLVPQWSDLILIKATKSVAPSKTSTLISRLMRL